MQKQNPLISKDWKDQDQGVVKGVIQSDTVMVPLEDGDRVEALVSQDKLVITIDLNPLSRTSQKASITIVDNIVRAIPHLINEVDKLENLSKNELRIIVNNFDNQSNLRNILELITRNYIKGEH